MTSEFNTRASVSKQITVSDRLISMSLPHKNRIERSPEESCFCPLLPGQAPTDAWWKRQAGWAARPSGV